MNNFRTEMSDAELEEVVGGNQVCYSLGTTNYCYTVNYCIPNAGCSSSYHCNTIDLGEYCVTV